MTTENNTETNQDEGTLSLWKPRSVGPIFQYFNWKQLNKPDEAKKSLFWEIGVFAYMLIGLLVINSVDSWGGGFKAAIAFIIIGFILNIVWNFGHSSKQSKYLDGNEINYEKKSILLPYGVGLGKFIIFSYLIYLAIVPSLESQAQELVSDIYKDYGYSSKCIAVKIDTEITDEVYKGTAFLDNGAEREIRIFKKNGNIQVTVNGL